jgi:hypothetical protein
MHRTLLPDRAGFDAAGVSRCQVAGSARKNFWRVVIVIVRLRRTCQKFFLGPRAALSGTGLRSTPAKVAVIERRRGVVRRNGYPSGDLITASTGIAIAVD